MYTFLIIYDYSWYSIYDYINIKIHYFINYSLLLKIIITIKYLSIRYSQQTIINETYL